MTASPFPLPHPTALAVTRADTRVPAVYWSPEVQSRGIVLASHGGGGHKLSEAVLAIANACCAQGMTVLAIDGPVHGDRRADGRVDYDFVMQAFQNAWLAGVGRTSMTDDWRAALAALLAVPGHADLPIGYIGVSMGTAYGLPLVAEEPRIHAAALGLWSATFPASEHLAGCAQHVHCPVWFTQQWNDEHFDRDGTLALFDAIASPDKMLTVYPGPHRLLEGQRLQDAVAFIVRRLLGPVADGL
jgi:dienelactone hydrolase